MKEFFARLNPTERRFVVGVGVVFFLVVNIVWVWPHFGDWGKTRAALDNDRILLAKFAAGTNQIPTLEKNIHSYQIAGSFVPPEDQIVSFFRQIQNQAAASRVGILSMGSSRQPTATDNPFFVEQSQTITLQSQEKELVDFLYQLGADPNSLIRVKVLSVQPDAPRQNLQARVTLVASYQRKEQAPTGTPAAGAKTPTPAAAPKTAAPPAGTKTSMPTTPVAPAGGPKPVFPGSAAPKPGAQPQPGQQRLPGPQRPPGWQPQKQPMLPPGTRTNH